MKTKSLDVIVPIYNTAKYLAQCIDSILRQDMINLSIVLIDDGSDDGSALICDEYAKKHNNVKVLHQNNRGVMSALNAGIRMASGDYVTVVDSDDWIWPNTYTSFLKAMDDGVDVITYPIIRFFSENYYYTDYSCGFVGIFEEKDIREKIIPNMIWDLKNKRPGLDPALCNKIFKKELLVKYINQASHLYGNYGQDVAVLYPMMKDVKTIFSSKCGEYFHRQRKKGTTAQYLRDDNFHRYLLDLYDYLICEFSDYEIVKKQIDYFFAESAKQRLRIYGEDVSRRYYLFPFSRVPYNSNVVIYGAGKIGQMYVEQLEKTKFCRLQGWADKYMVISQEGVELIKPESVAGIQFDAVIIAIFDKFIAETVKRELMELGIDENKIIWEMNCIKN